MRFEFPRNRCQYSFKACTIERKGSLHGGSRSFRLVATRLVFFVLNCPIARRKWLEAIGWQREEPVYSWRCCFLLQKDSAVPCSESMGNLGQCFRPEVVGRQESSYPDHDCNWKQRSSYNTPKSAAAIRGQDICISPFLVIYFRAS